MRSFVFVVCFLGFTNVCVRSDQDIEAQFHAMVAHLPYHRLMDVNETWCLDIAGRPIPRENSSVYCYTGALIVLSDDASEATVFQLDNETLPDKVKEAIPDEAFATGLGESIKYLKSVSSNSTVRAGEECKDTCLQLLSESFYQNKVYALLSLEPPMDRQRFRGMVKRREYNYELVKAENISLYARMAVEGVANIHIVESNSSDHPIFHAASEHSVLRRDFGGKTTSIRFIEQKWSEMEAMNRNFGKECFVEGCWIKGREKCCLMENNPLKIFRRSVIQIVANNDTCFDYNTALLNETIPPPNGTDHCVFRYNPVLEFSPMEARNVPKGECKSATIRQAEVFGIKTYGRETTCNFDLTKPIEENRKKLFSQQRICMNSTEKKGNAIACEYLIERSTASGSTKLTVLEGKNIWAVIQDDFREVTVPNRCFFLREDQKNVHLLKCTCIGTQEDCYTNPTELLKEEILEGAEKENEKNLLTSTAIIHSSCFPGRKIDRKKVVDMYASAYCYFVQDADTMEMVEEDVFTTNNYDSETNPQLSASKITPVHLAFVCNPDIWSMEEWHEGCKCVTDRTPNTEKSHNICCCFSFAYRSFRIIFSEFWRK